MGISSGLGSSALLPAGLGFRNKIINGDFRINQRGFTSTTTNGQYGFDRWRFSATDGTVTYSAQTFSLGNIIPNQEPTNFARIVTTGQTSASAEAALIQPIEDVRTCAGQTVTVSFWAKANSGTPKVAIEWQQRFGSGGSPSSIVFTYGGQVTISTSWAYYSLTFAVPSIAGKTIGTDINSSSCWLHLFVSAGSSLNSRTGSIGIQSNTFDFWGVQLEQNYQPTPFEQRPYGVELQLCQRYYYRATLQNAYGPFNCLSQYVDSTTTSNMMLQIPVPMRVSGSANTSIDTSALSTINILAMDAATGTTPSALTIAGNNGTFGVTLQCNTASAFYTTTKSYMLRGNNSSTAYIGISAEL